MPDREQTIKGLAEIAVYARAKADIAGIGKVKEVFDSWYRAAEDALALLEEQEAVEPNGYKCGKCGFTVHRINYDGPYNGIRHELFRFCPSCGREVKWDAADRCRCVK